MCEPGPKIVKKVRNLKTRNINPIHKQNDPNKVVEGETVWLSQLSVQGPGTNTVVEGPAEADVVGINLENQAWTNSKPIFPGLLVFGSSAYFAPQQRIV